MGYSLEETIKLNQLFDLYQEFLTDKQRKYFAYYFLDNYSLAEIANNANVSRNAVFLQIKNIVKILENFEAKLQLLALKLKLNELFKHLKEKELSEDIRKIIKEIEEEK